MMVSYSSIHEIVERIRREFSGAKLLALGQTVYWDEPMKVVLRCLLDRHYPEAILVAGIHDADYFSRVPGALKSPDNKWLILPHNDGTTRDLWVATGEISCLFGSETIPTRELFLAHGVKIDRAARRFPGGRETFIDMVTEAWGWRGLAACGESDQVACNVRLRDVLPAFLELLAWGFGNTLACLAEPSRPAAEKVCTEMVREVEDYAARHPEAAITEMYEAFLPRFYERLMRRSPNCLQTTSSCKLFRFNTATAHRRRFDLVRAFLNPETRPICQKAYDAALEDSDIYTLDRFCEGAIPFDLVIPGLGRGTICIQDNEVVIDMPEHVHMKAERPVTTIEALAEVVEEHFGTEAALVGKAVTLVLAASCEFIFVMSEQASAYVWRCEKMANLMKKAGLEFGFHPILRLDYGAWDNIDAPGLSFILPDHLARAFGSREITSQDFSVSWRDVVEEQERMPKEVAGLATLDGLLVFLAQRFGETWTNKLKDYLEAYSYVRKVSMETEPLKQESVRLRDLSHQLKQEAQRLEVEKGKHFRKAVKPLQDRLLELENLGITDGEEVAELQSALQKAKAERALLEQEIERLHSEGIRARDRHLEIKKSTSALERGSDVLRARARIREIEEEAELAKLNLVRDALLVSKGLDYTNHRPSAWWLMMVDPQMKWFDRILENTRLRFEDINGQSS